MFGKKSKRISELEKELEDVILQNDIDKFYEMGDKKLYEEIENLLESTKNVTGMSISNEEVLKILFLGLSQWVVEEYKKESN